MRAVSATCGGTGWRGGDRPVQISSTSELHLALGRIVDVEAALLEVLDEFGLGAGGNESRPGQRFHHLVREGRSYVEDSIHQLQGCNQCIQLQRAAEDSELDGVAVREIHAPISLPAVALGAVEYLLRVILVAVASRPLLELVLCASAEFEQLGPVRFEEVEDSGDGFLLLLVCVAEGFAADVDVKPAGLRLVG